MFFMLELFANTWKTYSRHVGMMLYFAIPFLISLAIPLLSPAPTYAALGGYFLRSGSLPAMSIIDWAIIAIELVISIYLLALALVVINLIVKATRTRTRVGAEALRNIGKYSFVVFCLFLAVKIIETGILWLSLERGVTEWIVYLFGFLASLGLFYAAPAVVLEEKKPAKAFAASYSHIVRKPDLFILWLVIAFISLAIVTGITYALIETPGWRQIAVALINSIIVLPLLLILQAHMYLTKYTILK